MRMFHFSFPFPFPKGPAGPKRPAGLFIRPIPVLVSGGLLISGCIFGDKKGKDSSPVHVPVVSVFVRAAQRVAVDKALVVSGSVEGVKTVKLGFLVGGRLNFIAQEEGGTIRSGQLLAALDPKNYRIALDMAEANFALAKDEHDRLQALVANKGISESDFDKATTSLKLARAQRDLQAQNLADTRLSSPISGMVLKRSAEVGEIVPMGSPLFTVADIHIVKITASLPENELNQVRVGMPASVYVPALDTSMKGKVLEVGAMAESASRAFTVKVLVDNSRARLRPGMVAEVHLDSPKGGSSALLVPAESVVHGSNDSNSLFVVDRSRNMAFRRTVTLGKLSGNEVEVLSGLSEQEPVVTGGQGRLSDGEVVRILESGE